MYIEKAKRTKSTGYNIAVADWFGKPQVLKIDISKWTGEIGQTIQVKEVDNVQVTRVHVTIRANHGSQAVLEEGEAAQSEADPRLWT